MFTIAECHAKAAQKLELAKITPQHKRSVTAAAEAWLLLAVRLEDAEVECSLFEGEFAA
jgi:hypothetical protein